MKNQLKNMIISSVNTWSDTDIYAISLYVYDYRDNPCEPTVTLGYNTESQVKKETPNAYDEEEARWNYAFWLQNDFFCFGLGDTAGAVRNWIAENNFPFYEENDPIWLDDSDPILYDELIEKTEKITQAFVALLVGIVREIHEEKILTAKFGRELPIIIHELEYYDEIAKQNIEANGETLVKEFTEFIENL